VPDGIPVIVTEILLSAGTGLNFSADGTGADDGLTSQAVAWPVAGAVELVDTGLLAAVVVGPAFGVLVEHAATEIVAAIVAIATVMAFEFMCRYPLLICRLLLAAAGMGQRL
jgi:hypothetical protein